MLILDQFVTDPEPCAYLPEQTSRLLYEVAAQLSPDEYEARMNAGWRKFGAFLFRPVCPNCRECRAIRILVDEFEPDRSQRRCLERNADLTVRFAHPTVDAERVALYNRYHAAQNTSKGWDEVVKTEESYTNSFLRNPLPTGVEVSVWEQETLCGVAITEVTPNVVSGIYHFHKPDESARKRSLGTFVILQTLELARRLHKPYAYFGYYVAGCGSLSYKARYQPCEIRTDSGEWLPFH